MTFASVTERVDVADSKSVAERRVGSSPTARTSRCCSLFAAAALLLLAENAENSVQKISDKGQGAEPMAR